MKTENSKTMKHPKFKFPHDFLQFERESNRKAKAKGYSRKERKIIKLFNRETWLRSNVGERARRAKELLKIILA